MTAERANKVTDIRIWVRGIALAETTNEISDIGSGI